MNSSLVELTTSTTPPTMSASAEHNTTSSTGPEPTQAAIKVTSVPLDYTTTTSVPLSSPVVRQFSSPLREVQNNQTGITTPAPNSRHLTLPPNLPSSTIPEQAKKALSHSTTSHKPLTTQKHISCP